MKWDQSKQYSHQELEAMQQDAIRRVQQMQQRSKQALLHSPHAPSLFIQEEPKPSPKPLEPLDSPSYYEESSNFSEPSFENSPPPQPSEPIEPASPPDPLTSVNNALASLGLDMEQLFILGLIVLFANDHADTKLLLALTYLLL